MVHVRDGVAKHDVVGGVANREDCAVLELGGDTNFSQCMCFWSPLGKTDGSLFLLLDGNGSATTCSQNTSTMALFNYTIYMSSSFETLLSSRHTRDTADVVLCDLNIPYG